MTETNTFNAESIVAFVSALTIALKTLDQGGKNPLPADPYSQVKEEILLLFDYDPDYANLSAEGKRDLEKICRFFPTHGRWLIL